MNRPHVICHMTQSLDGKVTGDFLAAPECEAAIQEYYRIHREFQADAFACGRITMEGSFTGGERPELSAFSDAGIPGTDYIADRNARFFAVSFDPSGRVGWRAARIRDEDPGYDDAHIIEVLCGNAPDAYLAYLQHIGVSYIFAGRDEMNIPLALEKLHDLFGIRKLLLEGGSILNGAFKRAGMIDALSLVVAPVTADAGDKALFSGGSMEAFTLAAARPLTGGSVWLQYDRTK